jgi:hypothetical protein
MKNGIGKYFAVMFVTMAALTGCGDDQTVESNLDTEVVQFMKDVASDPVLIDGVQLGDTWRLVREVGSYNDGDTRKEYDDDLISDPAIGNYKEFWTFDHEKSDENF